MIILNKGLCDIQNLHWIKRRNNVVSIIFVSNNAGSELWTNIQLISLMKDINLEITTKINEKMYLR